MFDKNVQARNKFVNKITTKIDKLNKDINLLIKVDNALKIQAGGGLMENLRNALTTPRTEQTAPDYTVVLNESTRIADELDNNVKILESTLKSLITSLASQRASTTSVKVQANNVGLNNINDKINTLKTNLDIDLLTSFNSIFEEYKDSTNDENTYIIKMNTLQVDDSVKELLHIAINIERSKDTGKTPLYAKYK
jgi:hypothetical protein